MCPTCNEGDGFLDECDECFAPVCIDCERIIEAMRYCWECAPKVRAEMAQEANEQREAVKR